jgi:hypothetical protein
MRLTLPEMGELAEEIKTVGRTSEPATSQAGPSEAEKKKGRGRPRKNAKPDPKAEARQTPEESASRPRCPQARAGAAPEAKGD